MTPFLRRLTWFDAATCAGAGLLLSLAAEPLAGWTGLSAAILRPAGLFLLPYAAVLAWLAGRGRLSSATVTTLGAVNAVWVVASIGLMLAAGSVTAFGYAFVAAQALVVAAIAAAQFAGARGADRTALA